MARPASAEALAAEAARLAYLRVEESQAERDRLAAALALAGFDPPALFNDPATDGQGYGALRTDGFGLLVLSAALNPTDLAISPLTSASCSALWTTVPVRCMQAFAERR